jgi:WD40 repeat protein/energy-coupling factor transporter ATP-binding protein EcfA2
MTNSESQTHTKAISNPFPGLRPFSMEESHLFFGREGQVEEVLNNLKQNRFVAVIGSSGSGKSSLIYCGVLPAVMKVGNWKLLTTRPGNTPLENLIGVIFPAVHGKSPEKEDIEEWQKDPSKLLQALKNGHTKENCQFLILIDQFEELFRYRQTGEKETYIRNRDIYVDFIVDAVHQKDIPLSIIFTMRSDFIGECSRFQHFTSLINKSNYLIPRMTRENFQRVIEGPLDVVGVKIDSKLTQQLLHDVGDNPDQLPVLQHALMRTWEYWTGHDDVNKSISREDYNSIGGIEKSLSEHANEAFDELNEKEKQICEKIFRSLTERGADNRGVRRPTKISRLAKIAQSPIEEIIKVVDNFRAHGRSFLTPAFNIEINKDSVIDLSHEALMRTWDKLRSWVDEESSAVQMYKRLADSAALFQVGKSGLWRPPDLHLASNWKKKNNPNIAWAERHDPAFERTMVFLEASEKEFTKEEENKLRLQKRQLRRTRLFALVLGSTAIVSLVMFLWTRDLSENLKVQFIAAKNATQLAELKTLEAEQQTEKAVQAAIEADQQRSRADTAAMMAEERRLVAEEKTKEAAKQTALAQRNLATANSETARAIKNQQEADLQRKLAEQASQEAFQRRMLSTAKSMAVKSQQVTNDPDLKALLAYQAHLFYTEYGGNEHDVDIYSGLYQSLKTLLGTTYNVYKGHTDAVRSVVFLPNTSSFITAGSDGRILKWNLGTEKKEFATILEGRGVIENMKISSDGKWLVAAESRKGLILCDLKSESVPRNVIGADLNIKTMAFAPDNKTVYVAGLNNFIEVLNMESGSIGKFRDMGSRVSSISISPDGAILAAGTRDGKTHIYSLSDDASDNEIYNDPNNEVQSVSFSPDGKYLACGTIGGDVMIFGGDTFKIVGILTGHSARITDIVFNENSTTMATSSYDGKVLYWDMTDLTNPPISMDDNSGFVFSVSISSDGKYLISGSAEEDRLISRPTEVAMLASKICALISRNFSEEEWNTYVGEDIPYQKTCSDNKSYRIGVKE